VEEVKLNIDMDQLLALDHEGYSVYGISTSPGKVVIKPESFPEGEVPPHLQSYVGQNAKVARACKGKKGMAFVSCMRRKSIEMGTAKKRE